MNYIEIEINEKFKSEDNIDDINYIDSNLLIIQLGEMETFKVINGITYKIWPDNYDSLRFGSAKGDDEMNKGAILYNGNGHNIFFGEWKNAVGASGNGWYITNYGTPGPGPSCGIKGLQWVIAIVPKI